MPVKHQFPVLDCSEIVGSFDAVSRSGALKTFAKKLGNQIERLGLVYLANHDPEFPKIVENLTKKMEAFFTLPKEVKAKYGKPNPVENFFGFIPRGEQEIVLHGKVLKTWREIFDFWGSQQNNEDNYPAEVPGLKKAVDAFRMSLADLSKKLLRCFAIYLGLEDEDFFINHHKGLHDPSIPSHTVFRSNYYFPVDGNDTRLDGHCDVSTMSFIIQSGVDGLETQGADGEWIPVPPLKDAIAFVVGQVMDYWAGGHLSANRHRVTAVGDTKNSVRQSHIYFIEPDGTSLVKPIVPAKSGWKPITPVGENQTQWEYFENIILKPSARSNAY